MGASVQGWRKSTFSGENECVEIKFVENRVLVRHSRTPAVPALAFDNAGWQAFLDALRHDGFEPAPA